MFSHELKSKTRKLDLSGMVQCRGLQTSANSEVRTGIDCGMKEFNLLHSLAIF